MVLPTSLRPTPLGLTSERASVATAARKLAFDMQCQEQSNWCWAAVASSVGHFFGVPDWSQCRIVQERWPALEPGFPATNCCEQPGQCNVQDRLDLALGVTRTFAGWCDRQATMAEVDQELEQGRPLCLRIQFVGKGAHFAAITGGGGRSDMIVVKDPLFGDSLQSFAGFPDHYQGHQAQWTETYRTSPPPKEGST